MFVLDVLPDEVRKIIFAPGGSQFVPDEHAFNGSERMEALDAWKQAGCPSHFVWFPPIRETWRDSYDFC